MLHSPSAPQTSMMVRLWFAGALLARLRAPLLDLAEHRLAFHEGVGGVEDGPYG